MPRIEKPHEKNFQTILSAARCGRLASADCYDTVENKPIRMLISVLHDENKNVVITPLAVMVDCDPYERYLPPGYDMQEETPT